MSSAAGVVPINVKANASVKDPVRPDQAEYLNLYHRLSGTAEPIKARDQKRRRPELEYGASNGDRGIGACARRTLYHRSKLHPARSS